MRRLTSFLVAFALTASVAPICRAQVVKRSLSDEKAAASHRIALNDQLAISVWQAPWLSTTSVVRPDGKITIPLLDEVRVEGFTAKELQDLVTEKLKSFVAAPQVTVTFTGGTEPFRQVKHRRHVLPGGPWLLPDNWPTS